MPDPTVIAEGLRRLGNAPTPTNVQRASDFIYRNPAVLNKLMGLQGGSGGESGEDSSVMLSQLDKLTNNSAPSVAAPTPQEPLPQAPLPENMRPAPTRSPASVTDARPVASGIDNTGGTTGPNPNAPPSMPTGASVSPDLSNSPTNVPSSESSGGLIPEWLKVLLGISAATAGGAATQAPRALPAPDSPLLLTGPKEPAMIPGPRGPMSLPPPGSVEALMLNTDRPRASLPAPSVGAEIDTGAYDGRPTNAGDPDRVTPPKDRPTNLEATTQKRGDYDGRPTNLDDEPRKASGRKALTDLLKGAGRVR